MKAASLLATTCALLAICPAQIAQSGDADTSGAYGALLVNPGGAADRHSGTSVGGVAHGALTKAKTRIVNGTVVLDAARYPWIVALAYKQGNDLIQYCAGSVVSEHWIVTAAHCQVEIADSVILGRLDLSNADEGREVAVREVVPGPFNKDTLGGDYALVRVDEALAVTPITIDPAPQVDKLPSRAVIIAGWGRTSSEGPSSRKLLWAEIRTKPFDNCKGAYSQARLTITTDMWCGSSDTSDACRGDSGGPAMLAISESEVSLVGVVSWGKDCRQSRYPGVYTRIADYCADIQKSAKELANVCAAKT